jgi:adenosylcobinamide-GDP ribazoletransferase
VVTLLLTLLLQVACVAALLPIAGGWLALWTAVVTARLAMARTGLAGVPFAEGSSLGRTVARTVSGSWLAGCLLAGAGLLLLATAGDLVRTGQLAGSAVAGLLAAEVLFRRARRRLGGLTGDVMGAMGETAMTVVLLTAAVVL